MSSTKFITLLVLLFSFTSKAADRFVVLSGGGSPIVNHYSQYLQTKTLYTSLVGDFGSDSVDVFFAAGNRPDQSPLMADVHRVIQEQGFAREVQIVGNIENNRQANKKNVMNFFSNELTSKLSSKDNLFVFVSDHGMPNQLRGKSDSTFSNNCIDMWNFEVDLGKEGYRSSVFFDDRCFAKSDLKNSLNKLPVGKTVFAMSQCYSGGFHQMSVEKDEKGYPKANPRVCGFSAITEDMKASGCTPDADGPNYQGYERSFTQELTGVDVVTGVSSKAKSKSLQEAHRRATLDDQTIDIPLATSDYYLLEWAKSIQNPKFRPRQGSLSGKQIKVIQQTQNTFEPRSSEDERLKSKRSFFKEQLEVLKAFYQEDSDKTIGELMMGDIEALRKKMDSLNSQLLANDEIYADIEDAREKVAEKLLTAWGTFVVNNKPSLLTEYELKLEANMSYVDKNYGFGSANKVLINISAIKQILSPEKAEAISIYKAKRLEHALAWANESKDPSLVLLARKVVEASKDLEPVANISEGLSKKLGFLRRILTYREVIGSWNALLAMNDQTALSDLHGLIDCEGTQF